MELDEEIRPLTTTTFLAVSTLEADRLRGLHAAGQDAAVLLRGRELASDSGDGVVIGPVWDPIGTILRAKHRVDRGEPVFSRRDYDIRLSDPAAVAVAAAILPEVSWGWMRQRYADLFLSRPGPGPPGEPADFRPVWDGFEELAVFFCAPSRFWRPARRVTGPDGVTRVVRPRYRPSDYAVDPSAVRTLPAHGGSWVFDADLTERDGALYSWTEVGRFTRGGRAWVRMTNSGEEYYIDVEIADDRIGQIEWVDPLIAYWLARKADNCPVILED